MIATVDRYNSTACHNRKIAALLCGRSFAKFLFHFSQWALVSRVSSTGDLPCDSQNQWQLAFAELKQLHIRCLEVEGSLTDGRHSIRDFMKRPTVSNETDMEEVLRLFDELEKDECENSDKLRESIVDIVVSPRKKRLRLDLQNTFRSEVAWFELGRILEEGLSRPDIYLFQIPFLDASPPVLRADSYSTQQLAVAGRLTSFNANPNNVLIDDSPEVTHITREPGDLIPHELWTSTVRHFWSAAGLTPTALQCITVLEEYRGPREHLRTLLIDCVNRLREFACSSAAGGLDRLSVDIASNIVEVDGTSYDVEPQVAYLFHAVKQAGGEESFARIKRQYPTVFGPHDKLTDVRKRMKKPLSVLLRSGTGMKVKLDLGIEQTPSSSTAATPPRPSPQRRA